MTCFYEQEEFTENRDGNLSHDFRRNERLPAHYDFPLKGVKLSREEKDELFKEFCNSKQPLLHLYMPTKQGEEKIQDLKVHTLNYSTFYLLDLTPDEEAVSFMQRYSKIRIGFVHRNETYVFETEVLGFIEDRKKLLLAERPETIYRERRKYQRYQLWPNYKAYLDTMQVHDISWGGLRVHSDTLLISGDVLKNVLLTLPPIYSPSTEICLFSGAKIRIPRVVVSYRITREICCYYGLYFDKEWDLSKAQKLGDFLLTLRKNYLLESCEPTMISLNRQNFKDI